MPVAAEAPAEAATVMTDAAAPAAGVETAQSADELAQGLRALGRDPATGGRVDDLAPPVVRPE